MNCTCCGRQMATPDSTNVERMLIELAPKLEDIVQRFRRGTPIPEMALAFETELDARWREGCRTLVETEYNDIEPAAIEHCPVRMQAGWRGIQASAEESQHDRHLIRADSLRTLSV